MTDTRLRLIQCFKAVFPTLSEPEILNASLASVPDWDSVAAISLLTVIEEEFNIEVSPDEVEDLISFAMILAYMEQLTIPSFTAGSNVTAFQFVN